MLASVLALSLLFPGVAFAEEPLTADEEIPLAVAADAEPVAGEGVSVGILASGGTLDATGDFMGLPADEPTDGATEGSGTPADGAGDDSDPEGTGSDPAEEGDGTDAAEEASAEAPAETATEETSAGTDPENEAAADVAAFAVTVGGVTFTDTAEFQLVAGVKAKFNVASATVTGTQVTIPLDIYGTSASNQIVSFSVDFSGSGLLWGSLDDVRLVAGAVNASIDFRFTMASGQTTVDSSKIRLTDIVSKIGYRVVLPAAQADTIPGMGWSHTIRILGFEAINDPNVNIVQSGYSVSLVFTASGAAAPSAGRYAYNLSVNGSPAGVVPHVYVDAGATSITNGPGGVTYRTAVISAIAADSTVTVDSIAFNANAAPFDNALPIGSIPLGNGLTAAFSSVAIASDPSKGVGDADVHDYLAEIRVAVSGAATNDAVHAITLGGGNLTQTADNLLAFSFGASAGSVLSRTFTFRVYAEETTSPHVDLASLGIQSSFAAARNVKIGHAYLGIGHNGLKFSIVVPTAFGGYDSTSDSKYDFLYEHSNPSLYDDYQNNRNYLAKSGASANLSLYATGTATEAGVFAFDILVDGSPTGNAKTQHVAAGTEFNGLLAPGTSIPVTIGSNTSTLSFTASFTPDPPGPAAVTYPAGQAYTLGGGNDLVIHIEKDLSLFDAASGVKANGAKLTDAQHKVEQGSTKVTLFANFLEQLGVGKHTVQVPFTDGVVVTAEITVASGSSGSGTIIRTGLQAGSSSGPGTAASAAGTSPRTGDDMNMTLWAAFALIAVLGIFASALRIRKIGTATWPAGEKGEGPN
jgi:hypothetical protein